MTRQATPAVGQRAGEDRADRAAEQCDGDDEAGEDAAEREVLLDRSTAPLMTDESKPKRKPPTAAATERPIARRPYGLLSVKASAGIESDELMVATLALGVRHGERASRCGPTTV